MFIGALWLYAISSLVGGLAWRPEVIIAARAVQGIGGAFLFPATLSLINRLFREGPERNRALAAWGRRALAGRVGRDPGGATRAPGPDASGGPARCCRPGGALPRRAHQQPGAMAAGRLLHGVPAG